MRVKSLIEQLENKNPNAVVRLHWKDGESVLFALNSVGDTENVWLECESDNNMAEEIHARFDNAIENGLDELYVYSEMLEAGIDVDMVRRNIGDEAADHMQAFCEEHGLLGEDKVVAVSVAEPDVDYAKLALAIIDAYESDRIESGASELEKGMRYILQKYHDQNSREIISEVLMSLTGWSLDTLQKIARESPRF